MPNKLPSTARLEAFSDGVIAVIITIMVLELKVPHENGVRGLYAIVPILLVYAISFAFTGIYWINHQHLLGRVESGDNLVLYANLGFLFCLSLLPFCTSYVIEKDIDPFSVSLYAVSMILIGFSFLLLRLAVHRQLRHSEGLAEEDVATRNKHLASLALYLSAIGIAYLNARISMAVVGLVTILWVVPTFAAPKRKRHPGK